MRKLTAILAAALAMAACSKDRVATDHCDIEIQLDWVKGSKAQLTVTPSDPNAYYAYGLLSDDYVQYDWEDSKLIEYQLEWMDKMYGYYQSKGTDASFADFFAVKGTHTIRETQLADDMNWRFIVFQINPVTGEAIGNLCKLDFHTQPIPKSDLRFAIEYKGDAIRIVPSNDRDTWFWEYELWSRMTGIYGSPYYFYYSLLDMYDQYGFLERQLCQGASEWVFSRDDRSIREGETYTMCISGCADGEITTEVFYVDFSVREGAVVFEDVFFNEVDIREWK